MATYFDLDEKNYTYKLIQCDFVADLLIFCMVLRLTEIISNVFKNSSKFHRNKRFSLIKLKYASAPHIKLDHRVPIDRHVLAVESPFSPQG